jgi:hypothetical protein
VLSFTNTRTLPGKFLIILFFLSVGCVVSRSVFTGKDEIRTFSELVVNDEKIQQRIIIDPFFHNYYPRDTVPKSRGGDVNVMEFGAKCDGITDDIIADSTACAYCIAHPFFCSTVVFPVGHSRISRPLLLQNNGHYFTIHLKGMLPAKEASDQYLSGLFCDYKSGYGIGIQLGRGVIIENLAITGRYTKPYSFSGNKVATFRFSDWIDSTISDSRYAPYAGISIDPYPNVSGGSGGTSGVEIRQCTIKQWMVGICLTPNAYTLNDEMINIIDDDIEVVRVAIAIGQDQSKEIHIDRFKCWNFCHTILDGITYGRGTGGGSVDINGGNISGSVNELFNLYNDRFSISVKDVYSESLFRIGTVGGGAGANFIDCQIDLLTIPGWPEPDFVINGGGNFYGGCIRYYDDLPLHRLNFVNTGSMFRDMTLSSPPITVGLVGWPAHNYPTARFDNVHLYNFGKLIKPVYDTTIVLPRGLFTYFNVDSIKWVSTMYGRGLGSLIQVGDYILGDPSSGNGNGVYYDRYLNPNGCPTIQIGQVQSISKDTLYMKYVGLNAPGNRRFDNIFISRLK